MLCTLLIATALAADLPSGKGPGKEGTAAAGSLGAAPKPALPDLGKEGGTKEGSPKEGVPSHPAAPGGVAGKALKQDEVCTRCHDESENRPVLSIYQTRHGVKADARTPTCQGCHGESNEHLKGSSGGSGKGRPAPDIVFGSSTKTYPLSSAADRSNKCLSCHQSGLNKCLSCHQSGLRNHWTGSQHQSREVACNTCHVTHTANDKVMTKATQQEVCFTCHATQRSQTFLFSTHPLKAGKMSCSDCHNPHGSTGPMMLVKNNVNETCHTCHAEKRGPFLWEHGPVSDDCTNCHTPHGSNNPPLLKQRVPWLCQDCHTADHAQALNSGADLIGGGATTINGQQFAPNLAPRAQANARACLNCHVMIHGSNHPAGSKFNR
jgi:DmsE family decaheme c-type cytochrome